MLAPFSFMLLLQGLTGGRLTEHRVDKYKEGAGKERH